MSPPLAKALAGFLLPASERFYLTIQFYGLLFSCPGPEALPFILIGLVRNKSCLLGIDKENLQYNDLEKLYFNKFHAFKLNLLIFSTGKNFIKVFPQVLTKPIQRLY